MGKRKESACVDCGLPCLREDCPYYIVEIRYCDKCGDDTDTKYYEIDDDELCSYCAEEWLERKRIK